MHFGQSRNFLVFSIKLFVFVYIFSALGFVSNPKNFFNDRGLVAIDSSRLVKTMNASIVSIRLVMFQTYFLVCIAGSDLAKQEIAQQ